MFVDIAQIPAEGLDVQFRETEDFLDPSGERVHLLRPVEATLHLRRNPTGVLVRGQISSDLQLHCSRCFELFTLPVNEEFEVQYRGPLGGEVGEEHELARDELDVNFLDESRINVEGLVRENVLLTLPAQPVCHEGCRGLCPRCGMNLNRGTCSCTSTPIDPRWSSLESLR
jgi:uncharacterized protein